MFEMKNENDTTATKKKMKISSLSLIKIEKKKAVICCAALLESDNEFYNNGIVDVSQIRENVCDKTTIFYSNYYTIKKCWDEIFIIQV